MNTKQNESEWLLARILSLYRRFGLKSVTMDDISRELGMSKKTLYLHFSDKTDLIQMAMDLEIEQIRDFVRGMYQSQVNAIQELSLVNEKIHSQRNLHSPAFYYDLKKYYPEIFRKLVTEKRQIIYKLISRNMEKGKSEGLYRADLNPHMIARLYLARMEMLGNNEIHEDGEMFSPEFIREVFIYHLHGICNNRGLTYLEEQINLN